jgi:hypothetical protein
MLKRNVLIIEWLRELFCGVVLGRWGACLHRLPAGRLCKRNGVREMYAVLFGYFQRLTGCSSFVRMRHLRCGKVFFGRGERVHVVHSGNQSARFGKSWLCRVPTRDVLVYRVIKLHKLFDRCFPSGQWLI